MAWNENRYQTKNLEYDKVGLVRIEDFRKIFVIFNKFLALPKFFDAGEYFRFLPDLLPRHDIRHLYQLTENQKLLSATTPAVIRRAVSALVLALIFFACCYSANWWDHIGEWSVILFLAITILFFWMLYLWIFEIALLIRDRKALTKLHFIPIVILSLYWIILISCYFILVERRPLSN